MSRLETDTIAAVATAPGRAGIAVVRVSGAEALRVADRVVHCAGRPPSERSGGRFVYGRVAALEGDPVDEAIVLVYRAPASYTREDVVEIQCHGGRAAAARVLQAVLEAGARPAEPGEFTRRAFLNGRLDLAEAEAVADLINARTHRAAAAALHQLQGDLSNKVNLIYNMLLRAVGDVEAGLDFEAEDLPHKYMQHVRNELDKALLGMDELLATWSEGCLLREGARVVIVGRPNAGKSSILNRLLGRERAIVAAAPGTTRDTVEEEIELEGIPVRLIDTAGLRDSACEIEREGVARARASRAEADVVLHVIDLASPGDAGEEDIGGQHVIRVGNKTDLFKGAIPGDMIPCCAITGEGIDLIRRRMADILQAHEEGPAHAAISTRHRGLLLEARASTGRARELLETHEEDESVDVLAAEQLREAMDSLGRIVGRTFSEELLDSVFSRFCIGK